MPAKRKPPAKKAKKKPAPRETKICSGCGVTAQCAKDGFPPGWSFAFSGGRAENLCPTCARRNIRAIEGKLPEEWWE